MSLIRRRTSEVMKDLPVVCAIRPSEDEDYVLVKRGEAGYWPLPEGFEPEKINEGLSAAQLETMRNGSLFGFHVPGADPLNWADRKAQLKQ